MMNNNKSNIQKLIELSKQQLQLELEAIRLAYSHNPSKGTEAENAIAKLLKKYMPKKYSFSSGFVTDGNDVSPQLDIVIYDEHLNAPVHLGQINSVFPVGAVYGAVEVTLQKLDKRKLEMDIEKLTKLRKLSGNRIRFRKIGSKRAEDGKGHVIAEEIIESGPPTRTYIIALSGTTYKSPAELADEVKLITKKHEAHIHGLLIFDKSSARKIQPGKEWLIETVAFKDYQTEYTNVNAFNKLVNSMRNNFEGMLVGKLPAVL